MDPSTLDLLMGGNALESAKMPTGRQHRMTAKRRFQSVTRTDALKDALGPPPKRGESIHVVSDAKYDFWHFVPLMIGWLKRTDHLYCSTWTASRPNVLDLFAVHDAGEIAAGQIHFLTGLYFKRRESAVYALLLNGITERGGRYKAFENHCKVLLLANEKSDTWLTVEGSANLTANPRCEQYVVTNDRDLHDFHRQWMDDQLAAPDRKSKSRPKAARTTTGYSCRRAGLGVLAACNDHGSRRALIKWKLAAADHTDADAATYAAPLIDLIRECQPVLPPDAVVTCPPQGASWPRDYCAERIARIVAAALDRPFRALLTRTDEKTHHSPHAALAQAPFECAPGPERETVIIVDDLITSGATMRLALAAVRATARNAFGFAFNAS